MTHRRDRRRALRAPFVVSVAALAAALAPACGGHTSTEAGDAGPGGAGGSGGSGGAGGSGGSGGTVDPSCPAETPTQGDACASPGHVCSYANCHAPRWLSDATARCESGAWTISVSASCNPPPPPMCPSDPPAAGSGCAPNPEGFACEYPSMCCGTPTGGKDILTCRGGVWVSTSVSTCNPPAAVCPPSAPADGDDCARSLCGATLSCTFGDCATGDAVAARCDGSIWHVAPTNCADGGGGVPEGAACGASAGGAACQSGLACCYPCGVQGCTYVCTKPCDPTSPGCFNGCLALP